MITNNFCNNFIFIFLFCFTTITSAMNTDLCISEKLFSQAYSQKVLFYELVKDLIIENKSPEQLTKTLARSLQSTNPYLSKPDLDFLGNHGNTLLHVAAYCDHLPILTLLLENGANLAIKNKKLRTPFAMAIRSQSRDCCLKLIEYGATKESMYIIKSLSTPGKNFCKLYRYKGNKPKNEVSKKYFAFMAPVHSTFLNKELMPLYRQQQYKSALFANFILQHYLYLYGGNIVPIREFMRKRQNQQEIRYLITCKLLEVSNL